ncbi:MAG: hypothetical protein WBZ36_07015 [Candidatus Nitrosopolaris sp.]
MSDIQYKAIARRTLVWLPVTRRLKLRERRFYILNAEWDKILLYVGD